MDAITYIPDLAAFRLEAEEVYKTKGDEVPHSAAVFLSKDDDDNMLFNACKIPVHYNGMKSVCLIRTKIPQVLDALDTMEVIGECLNNKYIFVKGGQDKYEAAYDTSTRMVDDGDGNEIEYTPPYMIGVFS